MPSAPKHDPRIDALRGLAALSVAAFHFFGAVFGRDVLKWNGLWRDVSSSPSWEFLAFYPLSFGWAGVALFFVLSGYLIHGSYLSETERTGRFSWWGYINRRFWRIYPAYFVVLTVAAIGQNQILTKNYVYHLLLVHNLRDHFFFGLIGVFWTLAVEVQLYAMYPIALLLRRRWGTTGALGTSLLIAIVFWVIAGSLMDWSGPLGFVRVNNPLTLWPAWLIGAWLIERHRYGRSGFMRPVVVGICATIALFTASLFKPTFAIATFTLAAIASAALVDRVMATPRQSGRFVSGLAVAGACSYSLYMLHQPLFIWLVKAIGPVPPLEMMLIGLPISLIFAVAVASRPARIQVTVV